MDKTEFFVPKIKSESALLRVVRTVAHDIYLPSGKGWLGFCGHVADRIGFEREIKDAWGGGEYEVGQDLMPRSYIVIPGPSKPLCVEPEPKPICVEPEPKKPQPVLNEVASVLTEMADGLKALGFMPMTPRTVDDIVLDTLKKKKELLRSFDPAKEPDAVSELMRMQMMAARQMQKVADQQRQAVADQQVAEAPSAKSPMDMIEMMGRMSRKKAAPEQLLDMLKTMAELSSEENTAGLARAMDAVKKMAAIKKMNETALRRLTRYEPCNASGPQDVRHCQREGGHFGPHQHQQGAVGWSWPRLPGELGPTRKVKISIPNGPVGQRILHQERVAVTSGDFLEEQVCQAAERAVQAAFESLQRHYPDGCVPCSINVVVTKGLTS